MQMLVVRLMGRTDSIFYLAYDAVVSARCNRGWGGYQ